MSKPNYEIELKDVLEVDEEVAYRKSQTSSSPISVTNCDFVENITVSADEMPKTYVYPLLTHITDHLDKVPLPKTSPKKVTIKGHGVFREEEDRSALIRGGFQYFHYGCDNFNDKGWGCAYRTLQTMCSWIIRRRGIADQRAIPNLPEIQKILVEIQDKQSSFVGSKQWIGALEVFYVVDALYDVPCKILHVRGGAKQLHEYADILETYFTETGGFAMMGGDVDASSKGIIGIHRSENAVHLLIVVSLNQSTSL